MHTPRRHQHAMADAAAGDFAALGGVHLQAASSRGATVTPLREAPLQRPHTGKTTLSHAWRIGSQSARGQRGGRLESYSAVPPSPGCSSEPPPGSADVQPPPLSTPARGPATQHAYALAQTYHADEQQQMRRSGQSTLVYVPHLRLPPVSASSEEPRGSHSHSARAHRPRVHSAEVGPQQLSIDSPLSSTRTMARTPHRCPQPPAASSGGGGVAVEAEMSTPPPHSVPPTVRTPLTARRTQMGSYSARTVRRAMPMTARLHDDADAAVSVRAPFSARRHRDNPPSPPASFASIAMGTPRRCFTDSTSSLPAPAFSSTAVVSSAPSCVAPGSASIFHATAPSSFVPAAFDASAFYAARCIAHGVTPSALVAQRFAEGMASGGVWDCGYLYLGHRGVLPLLDVLEHGGAHVEELSLRGTGMRSSELIRLVDLIRRGITLAPHSGGEPSEPDHRGRLRVLRTLDVSENPLSERAGAQLLLLVNMSPPLTRVHVADTRIDQVTVRALTSACAHKLALRPSTSHLSTSRAHSHAVRVLHDPPDDDPRFTRALAAWKTGMLDAFMRRGDLDSRLALDADEAKCNAEASVRERDRQAVRTLLRGLQTDSDILGLLLRYDTPQHGSVWRDVRVVRRFVKRLIETGHPRKAFELADRYVTPIKPKKGATPAQIAAAAAAPNFAQDQLLQWWRVYALARSMNFTDAFKEIHLLLSPSSSCVLTPAIRANLLSLAGLLRKCMYENGSGESRGGSGELDDIALAALREEDAQESAHFYLQSYQTAHGLMEGVTAATMLRLANKDAESTALAARLLKEATSELDQMDKFKGGADVEKRKLQLYSAMAEANINLHRPNAAYKYYDLALGVSGGNVTHLAQLQQNLQLLAAKSVPIGSALTLFQGHGGNVCVFYGFAVDHPAHDLHAFPHERALELELSYQLELALRSHQVHIGFVGLACGSEILFAEKLLERKIELHVVLPFHVEDFLTACVDYGLPSMIGWKKRAQAVLAKCQLHVVTEERYLNDTGLFEFQATVMEGLARIRAREIGAQPPVAMAVLDSHSVFRNCRPNRFIRAWKAKGKSSVTSVVDLQEVRRRVMTTSAGSASSLASLPRGHQTRRFSDANSIALLAPIVQDDAADRMAEASADGADDMFTATPTDASPAPRPVVLRPRAFAPSSSSSSSRRRSLVGAASGAATMEHTITSTGRHLTAIQFASRISRVVKFMAFCDIEPGESMDEELTPVFFKTFFKLLEKARTESNVNPFYANTWGSGLYFLFHTVSDCADFSLHLLHVVSQTDWASLGLPPAAAMVGMHGGPLFPGYNPVEEKNFFFGAHVCRAARIKAITPQGHAYASEQFVAALAVAEADAGRRRFFYEYLGHRDLAKSYDRCALYRLCRIEDVRKHAMSGASSSSVAGGKGDTEVDPQLLAAQKVKERRQSDRMGKKSVLAALTAKGVMIGQQNNAAAPGEPGESTLMPASPLAVAELLPSSSAPSSTPPLSNPDGALSAASISSSSGVHVSRLVESYLSMDVHADGPSAWSDVSLLHSLVTRLISLAQMHVAFLVVQKALAYDSPHKDDLKLKYYRVLALRHTQKADEFMAELKSLIAAHPDPSALPLDLRVAVLSLSARMLKDKFYASVRNRDPQLSFAHESAKEYWFCYELQQAAFPAINAATMLLMSNQRQRAHMLARFAIRIVADELKKRANTSSEQQQQPLLPSGDRRASNGQPAINAHVVQTDASDAKSHLKGMGTEGKDDYWLYGTMGEAYLLLGESEHSVRWYEHALAKAANHMGSIAGMYRNVTMLQRCVSVPRSVRALFEAKLGRVMVCAAHPLMPWNGAHPTHVLDATSPTLRDYRALESHVQRELCVQLSRARPSVGFVLLLSDTDLLLAESLLSLGLEVHVLLADTQGRFMSRCVEQGWERMDRWRARLDSVFKRAILHFVTRVKQRQHTNLLVHFNRRVLMGMAILRAQQLDCGHPLAMCVLEGVDAEGSSLMGEFGSPSTSPFPSLALSSGGVDFPQQWCDMHADFTCTLIHLDAVRRMAAAELAIVSSNPTTTVAAHSLPEEVEPHTLDSTLFRMPPALDADPTPSPPGPSSLQSRLRSRRVSGGITRLRIFTRGSGMEIQGTPAAALVESTVGGGDEVAMEVTIHSAGVLGSHTTEQAQWQQPAQPRSARPASHNPRSHLRAPPSLHVTPLTPLSSMAVGSSPPSARGYLRPATSIVELADRVVPSHIEPPARLASDAHAAGEAHRSEDEEGSAAQADAITRAVDATYRSRHGAKELTTPREGSAARDDGAIHAPTHAILAECRAVTRPTSAVPLKEPSPPISSRHIPPRHAPTPTHPTSSSSTAAAAAASHRRGTSTALYAAVTLAEGQTPDEYYRQRAEVAAGNMKAMEIISMRAATNATTTTTSTTTTSVSGAGAEWRQVAPVGESSSSTPPTPTTRLRVTPSPPQHSRTVVGPRTRKGVERHDTAAAVAGMPAAAAGQQHLTASFGTGANGAGPSVSPPPGVASSFIAPTLTSSSYSRAVRFLLFADVRNYSKLSQEQTPLFCTHFLNIVRQVIDLFLEPHGNHGEGPEAGGGEEPATNGATKHTPSLEFWNTWGDGLFVVFSDAVQCARFALVLLRKVLLTQWHSYGLPPDLTMRVGLHAGPVLVGWDPVVRRNNFFGPHVLYAQLIEPITTPGCAFATAQFAACLATSAEAHEFRVESIGSAVLEKDLAPDDEHMGSKVMSDYATCHLFHVQENLAYHEEHEQTDTGAAGGQEGTSPTASAIDRDSPISGTEQATAASIPHAIPRAHGTCDDKGLAPRASGVLLLSSSPPDSPRPGYLRRVSLSSTSAITSVASSLRASVRSDAGADVMGPPVGSGAPAGLAQAQAQATRPRHVRSRSLTAQLLRMEEINTQRENAWQAREFAQARQRAAQAHAKEEEGQAHGQAPARATFTAASKRLSALRLDV